MFGVLFVALGLAICSKTNLGILGPAFIINEAVALQCKSLSVGVIEYTFQGLLLIILCFAIWHFNWRYLLAFAVAVLHGYTLNLYLWIFDGISFDIQWLRWIVFFVGELIIALGVACFFRSYLPLNVYDLFVAEFSQKFRFNINKTKWVFDLSMLTISVVLAFTLFDDAGSFDWLSIGNSCFHTIGLGTIIIPVTLSPLVALTGKLIDRCFTPSTSFRKVEKLLKRT